MVRTSAALGLISVLLMVTSGWALTGPDVQGRSEAMQPQSSQNFEEKTFDDLLVEVAKRAPGFGGMFIDEDGQLSVYLLDLTQSAAAEAAIAAVFGPELTRRAMRVLQGQHSFLQLKEWHDRMADMFEISGVALTDIDEAHNRLKVGLEQIDKRDLVEQELSRLDIPHEAVLIEETGPIRPVSNDY